MLEGEEPSEEDVGSDEPIREGIDRGLQWLQKEEEEPSEETAGGGGAISGSRRRGRSLQRKGDWPKRG